MHAKSPRPFFRTRFLLPCRNQAILDFLTIAQDLEQYGVTYFEVGCPL